MSDELLFRMANRLAGSQGYMASLVAIAFRREMLNWETLAGQLKLSPSQLAQLALCRRPRPAQFAADADRIAQYIGMDMMALVRFIRRAEALEALEQGDSAQSLLAARDRDPEA